MKHGGDIYTEGILKGRELVDYSSNINPLGIPKCFVNNIQEALHNLNKYPDAKYRELKRNLKEYVNNYEQIFNKNFKKKIEKGEKNDIIEERDIILGNGAAEIIDLVISCFTRVMIPIPSFGEYLEDANKWKVHVVNVNCKEDMDYDYEQIMNNLYQVDAVILGNPNNPDGKIIDKCKFEKILDYCETNNKKVIVDEAFIEFTNNASDSFIRYVKKYKCLFIIKALTKFYAMPGIRLGFGITKDEKLLKLMKQKQNPWNVNCFAETAAKYVLNDYKYIKDSLKWIEEERENFLNLLNKIPFIERVYNTHSNFVLCKLNTFNCDDLYKLCLEKGIVIRKCDNFQGLDKSYVRFAIKDKKTNMFFINILKNLWEE